MATNALQQQHPSSSTQQHTLLIATIDADRQAFLAAQLDADGHTLHEAHHTEAVIARVSACPIDVLILGELERPADAFGLLRAIRSGRYPRIHPGLAVVTLGADDELTVLHAYESGSDHHLPDHTGYLLLRAVLASVVRRALEDVTTRYLQAGEIHVDLAARSVEVAGTRCISAACEFELLAKFAADPVRVFSKHQLAALHLALRDQRTHRRKPRHPTAHPPRWRRRRRRAHQHLGPRLVADPPPSDTPSGETCLLHTGERMP